MYIYVYVYICIYMYKYVPFLCEFLPPLTGEERPLSVDWCEASLALAWSPKIRRKSWCLPFAVLICALVPRNGVYRMQNFFKPNYK